MNTEKQLTSLKLLNWDDGQTQSERLAADVLSVEGFESIDPTHPLGGPDGLKDMKMRKDGRHWIAAAHFPNGKTKFSAVKRKFADDIKGVALNDARGFAFITNQHLSEAQREELRNLTGGCECEIFHHERLRVILDSAAGLPIRERYLGIAASPADLLAGIDQLSTVTQMMTLRSNADSLKELRQRVALDLPTSGALSFTELIRLAAEQQKPHLHRGYVVTGNLLPALSNLDHPIHPIIVLDEIPEDLANCYRHAYEAAMLLFFLQRCVGLPYTERLQRNELLQIVRVIERLWRSAIRLRPSFKRCQSTLLMVGANRAISPCAHMIVYMSAGHFVQEVLQASQQIGYTVVADSLSQDDDPERLPYDGELIVARWPEVVESLRENPSIHEGYRLLTDAFDDLSAEVIRAARYDKGLPIIPTWMIIQK